MISKQDLIIKIAFRFINVSRGEIDARIDESLRDLGEFYQADHCLVLLLSPDTKEISKIYGGIGEKTEDSVNLLKNIYLANYFWLIDQLSLKNTIILNDVNDLPAKAMVEKQELHKLKIKSLMVAPLFCNDTSFGFLVVAVTRTARRWLDDEIELLKIVADIITSALYRKKTEEKLADAESLYHLIIDKINEGIAICHNDRFIFVNNKLAEMLGYTVEELTGEEFHKILTNRGIELFHERQSRRKIGKTVPRRYETSFKCKDGRTIEVEVSPVETDYRGELATFAVISDISEYKRLSLAKQAMEVKWLKQQRLMSLTLMIGGIIHYIKNTLTVVMGRAQMLKTRLPELKEPDIIVENVRKIESLLTSFIDKMNLELENKKIAINLSELLKNELLFLETESFFKAQIEKEIILRRDLPTIAGYYSDFSQSLMNIIHCCVESMRDSPQKILKIETGVCQDNIYVEIATTGRPIIPDNADKLFTPSFYREIPETEESSDLTALIKYNLYNAYILLSGYGAKFSAFNNPESGSTIRIELPIEKNN
ncbi:MAG TPA: PAS domain S-box protein [Candidatus Marinimicrobia bacterium]|nr:PAS domain S-box protein [Candidatus Neomarinimicrobiota bacterium]HRS52359.1 PAS domain S-box protein [Candidatus Neomarinimicrobiota bacterium]HRU92992.1 PAS domain S-box protein [Candidatus Neomarinimicrobiota bacterium]